MTSFWKRLILPCAFLLTICGLAVGNDYYTHGGFPATGSVASSSGMRAELDSITAGFDKLPTFAGNANKPVVINGGATGLTVAGGTLSLAGNLATTGAFNTTFAQGATTTLTLPSANGTLATLAGSETFTTKTFNLASNTLTGTTAQFNTALSDNDFATLAGSESLSNKTLPSPILSGTATGTYTLGGNGTLLTSVVAGHSLGGSFSSSAGLYLSGAIGSAASPRGIFLNYSFTGLDTGDLYALDVVPTATEPASGTTTLASVRIVAPNIIGAGGVFGNATTLHVSGAPTAGSISNRALWVSGSGLSHIEGPLQLDSVLSMVGGGIQFPSTQVPSANVNTLDDYEEGTWTPSLGGNATYTSRSGEYIKVGRKVTVSFQMTVNVLGTGSATTVSGLPFTSRNSSGINASGALVFTSAALSITHLTGQIASNSTTIGLFSCTAACASDGGLSVLGNGTNFGGSITYLTES